MTTSKLSNDLARVTVGRERRAKTHDFGRSLVSHIRYKVYDLFMLFMYLHISPFLANQNKLINSQNMNIETQIMLF